jgi:hypothetical protein
MDQSRFDDSEAERGRAFGAESVWSSARVVDGDVTLPDRQAILVYLARQYGGEAWLPSGALTSGASDALALDGSG